jgi:16S rRNA C1402 N4-methylase RsmH
MNKPQHVPVLLDEVLQYLNVRPGGVIVDATVGLGGHSAEIAKRLGARGRLICFDRDPQAMELAKSPDGRGQGRDRRRDAGGDLRAASVSRRQAE